MRNSIFLLVAALARVATAQVSLAPDWTAESNSVAAQLGVVATAGDVNADGYADVLVGAPEGMFFPLQGGGAFLYRGGPAGLSATAAFMLGSGHAGDHIGAAVSTAGDVNGDGFADFLIGAPGADLPSKPDCGKCTLCLGAPTAVTVFASLFGESISSNFGFSVAPAGDVNGDGYGDVLVGADLYDGSFTNAGKVYLYLGSATGLAAVPAWTAEGQQDYAYLWRAVGVGDVNADGFPDVVVGSDGYSNGQAGEGGALLWLASPSGLGATPAWTAEGNQDQASFGYSVAAGDVNGDGFADVAIGAHGYDGAVADSGRVFVFHGSPSGLGATAASIADGPADANGSFAFSMSGAGDVDADGCDDLVVGAWGHDGAQVDAGGAYLYRGSPSGLGATPAWSAEGGQASESFGLSVAGAGDVDGDGDSEVLVGGPGYDGGQTNEGRAYLYSGCHALAAPYGSGKPGSTGIPQLSSSAPPQLGATSDLTITGGSPGAGPVLVLFGVAPAALPFDGGTLLVSPLASAVFPALDAAGSLALPIAVPAGAELCGFEARFQAMIVDPGAGGFHHTAQTNGLRWELGG